MRRFGKRMFPSTRPVTDTRSKWRYYVGTFISTWVEIFSFRTAGSEAIYGDGYSIWFKPFLTHTSQMH